MELSNTLPLSFLGRCDWLADSRSPDGSFSRFQPQDELESCRSTGASLELDPDLALSLHDGALLDSHTASLLPRFQGVSGSEVHRVADAGSGTFHTPPPPDEDLSQLGSKLGSWLLLEGASKPSANSVGWETQELLVALPSGFWQTLAPAPRSLMPTSLLPIGAMEGNLPAEAEEAVSLDDSQMAVPVLGRQAFTCDEVDSGTTDEAAAPPTAPAEDGILREADEAHEACDDPSSRSQVVSWRIGVLPQPSLLLTN